MSKQIVMIAGPNGAGKTTTAIPFVSSNFAVDEFVNADEIARGLAPMHPESVSLSASKLMLKRLKELLKEGMSVAFETTGAATNYVRHLKAAQDDGYAVHLLFLWLPSADVAVQRVIHRVQQGGHHIPEETIRRRYTAGLKNLIKHYLPICNSAIILDNSASVPDKVIALKSDVHGLMIKNQSIWDKIEEVARAR